MAIRFVFSEQLAIVQKFTFWKEATEARRRSSILVGTVSGPPLQLPCHRASNQVHLLGLRSAILLPVPKLKT